MQNWQQTLYAQFANSPSLVTILDGFSQAVDPGAVIDDWYDNVWNVQTATGWGLDVWGRIVGVNRVLQLSDVPYLGFAQGADSNGDIQPFGFGVFYRGVGATTNYALADDAYRTLILAKAAANITDGSIISVNAILMVLFGASGNIWVADNGDMSVTVEFDFQLSAVQAAIIEQSGVIPRPSGCAISFQQVSPDVAGVPLGTFTLGRNTIS